MKIALFSDIHANLPAFEAFLADLDARKPDAVYCLGDLVGYNVWPNEIIAEIRRRQIPTLAGNHDLKKLSGNTSGKNHAYHLIDEADREYLQTLPSHIRLEYRLKNELFNVLMVHGSPRANDEYVLEELPEEIVLEWMNEARADILICAHSHKPYHRIIESKSGLKQIINTGSVGKPKDGNPQGGYVMLTLDKNQDLNESLKVDFIRFDYDVEKAAKAIEASPLPNELADCLRKAY
jgi:putative phosphoesterase